MRVRFFYVGAVSLMFALGIRASQATADGDEKAKAPVVFVETVQASELFETLTYPARVVPQVNAPVVADADGIVVRVGATLGKATKRGQQLFLLKHSDPVYEYAPVVVTSPVDGVVSAVEVAEGSRVLKGQKLATVTDPDQARILVEIAVPDLTLVHKGLSGEFSLTGGQQAVAVKVQGVSPFVDPATGTASCELTVDNAVKDARLPIGAVGRVHFKVDQHKGYQVPEHAIVYRANDPFVRVVDGSKAKYLPVKVGLSRRGQVEVLSGLTEGAQLVVRASSYVVEGEEVVVQNAEVAKK